jgi:hypothetical protein
MKKIIVTMKRCNLRTILPGGKMPPATAGRDARRHIFRHALWHAVPSPTRCAGRCAFTAPNEIFLYELFPVV